MVKEQNPIMVIILIFCTFGIYGLFWAIRTKNEMNELGADIPTAWLLIIPLVNIFWLWKYCEGYEQVSKGDTEAVMLFIIYIVFSPIAIYMVQSGLNKLA
jgi:ABC-type transport system involved in cytochrome c biogenesis permease subunit